LQYTTNLTTVAYYGDITSSPAQYRLWPTRPGNSEGPSLFNSNQSLIATIIVVITAEKYNRGPQMTALVLT
jgi:hypothetical protein